MDYIDFVVDSTAIVFSIQWIGFNEHTILEVWNVMPKCLVSRTPV
jgi:hypothetical protein